MVYVPYKNQKELQKKIPGIKSLPSAYRSALTLPNYQDLENVNFRYYLSKNKRISMKSFERRKLIFANVATPQCQEIITRVREKSFQMNFQFVLFASTADKFPEI